MPNQPGNQLDNRIPSAGKKNVRYPLHLVPFDTATVDLNLRHEVPDVLLFWVGHRISDRGVEYSIEIFLQYTTIAITVPVKLSLTQGFGGGIRVFAAGVRFCSPNVRTPT